MNYRLNDPINIEGIFTKYSLQLKRVTVAYPGKMDCDYPFGYYPLKISPLGDEGYMPPENLPFDHKDLITGLSQDNLCTHRRTSTKCRIKYDPFFAYNGVYTLTPLDNNDPKTCISITWDYQSLRTYLDSMKGAKIVATGSLHSIYDSNQGIFHKEVISTRVFFKKIEDVYFVVVFPDGSLISYPATLFMDAPSKMETKDKTYDKNNDRA
jgi:hypothetical protein